MNLVPAYGRDYRSKASVEADFRNGKDFRIADISSPDDGRYCSCRDFQKGTRVTIRYAKLRKVTVITI